MLIPAASASVALPPRVRGHLRGRQAGFTIIELMIALLVLGVLTAVALPSFLDSIRKGRRSEAFAALATMQQGQERWRTNNPSYSTTLADLGVASSSKPSGYYTLDVGDPATGDPADIQRGYVISAEGVAGTSQANDTQCRRLGVRVLDGAIGYAGCGSCTSFGVSDYTPTHPCWKR